jgi:hypothetical protein
MTATINASNSGSGGLISTGDASGSLALQTAGTTAVTIDTSQNVGIGVTPVTTSLGPSVQLGNQMTLTSYNGNSCYIDNNIYYNGAFKYTGNGFGTSLRFTDGNYVFSNAPNNTSGAGASATLTERMRIDSSGNLLVGAITAGAKFHLKYDGNATVGQVCDDTYASAGTNKAIQFKRNSVEVGTITITTTATAYNTSSDYRLKENIAPMTDALAKVAQLKPVTYKWKSDGEEGQGFIAHELQEVVPDCVTGAKDAVDADGNPQYQGIDTSFLVATLTAAIQEQQALITAQAETINALTARIVALEEK